VQEVAALDVQSRQGGVEQQRVIAGGGSDLTAGELFFETKTLEHSGHGGDEDRHGQRDVAWFAKVGMRADGAHHDDREAGRGGRGEKRGDTHQAGKQNADGAQ
jgi:hypothetical protein